MSEGIDPKGVIGATKAPLHLIPKALNTEIAWALHNGAVTKGYGVRNWSQTKVLLSTYVAAMKRHLDDFMDGEDRASDSGVHHLGHVAAGCGIILDAARCGTLFDDRVLPQPQQTTP
jgi:hypothetical protein